MDEKIKKIFYDKRSNLRKGMGIAEHRFAVLLPSKTQNNIKIKKPQHKAYKAGVMEFLMTELGGATNYVAEGYYKKNGTTHVEAVIVCESYISNEKLEEKAVLFRGLCNMLCMELDQESISGVMDGEMVFFEPTLAYRTSPHAPWHTDSKHIKRIKDIYLIPALAKKGLVLQSKDLIAF